jgi:CHAT domain-containing protein/Tfp pilus assembly protein PilF
MYARLAVAVLLGSSPLMLVQAAESQNHERSAPEAAHTVNDPQWQILNRQVTDAYRAGNYKKGTALAEALLRLARQTFGDQAPKTLTSLNNLATFYDAQGRYREAEPLYRQALQARLDVLGPRHPDTMNSAHDLAVIYQGEGRYGEAERLYLEVLQARRDVLGPRHPDTLTTVGALASLYKAEGRDREAGALRREALKASGVAHRPRLPDTGAIHENHDQAPSPQSEPPKLTVSVQAQDTQAPPDHPSPAPAQPLQVLKPVSPHAQPLYALTLPTSLQSLNMQAPVPDAKQWQSWLANMQALPADTQQLAAIAQHWLPLNSRAREAYQAGDFAQAATFAEWALALARLMFGDRALPTLTSLNNLATFYLALGRHGEAEPLFREALQGRREVLGSRNPDTLQSLNNLGRLYTALGRYGDAEPLFREALQGWREVLGPHHPNTLIGIEDLADLYRAQGRYGDAEPLFREVLQARRDVLGARHPGTLTSMNNLALLYFSQGRFDEAEPLYRETLQARREVLGPRHPETLISLNNLAHLYSSRGRYGEAEPVYQEALQASREVLGARHPNTLIILNNLSQLYQSEGRYSEAEALLREALQASRETLGARHPNTLTSLANLAEILRLRGRYGEVESLLREALQAMTEVFGPRHPGTLTVLNNLGLLYDQQGRYGEAEPLFQAVLQAKREVLGPRHPDTLASIHDLAILYDIQDRYGEAEPLLREALEGRREVLGPHHRLTLLTQSSLAWVLVEQDRRDEAVRMLQQMEINLLGRIGEELYSTEAGGVRRQLVSSSQASYQDMVLTLATAAGSSNDTRRLAATMVLRFKLVQGEEEAYLARLARRSQDPRVQALVNDIGKLRAILAAAAEKAPAAFEKTLQALEGKRRELIDASPDYKDRLRVLDTRLDDVRKALPSGSALVEFRQFRPVEFRAGKAGEPHFVGLLLTRSGEPEVADLGTVAELQSLATAMDDPDAARGVAPIALALDDQAASKLYERLLTPFKDAVAAATEVYVAPDGLLNLIPFARLKLPDGRYWFERQAVHILQTGRDLLRPEADHQARGLLALGGIDFSAAPVGMGPQDTGPQDSVFFAAAGSDHSAAVTRAAQTFKLGFGPLPATADEVKAVTRWYQAQHAGEPVEIWSGAEASKARLMALKTPPRVLHLATHGFYLHNQSREPMLLSGIALAGANREVAGTGTEGLLFALEAEGLNLDGTELVVLSACDTAQGSIDYSEGVFGLARALRTAGARNVLVTLWPLEDGEARDFMADFYKNWASEAQGDPATALRDTQRQWINQDDRRHPRAWAPYLLIE